MTDRGGGIAYSSSWICLFHSIHSALFEIESVATLASSGSDQVTISASEAAFHQNQTKKLITSKVTISASEGKQSEEAFHFLSHGWQGEGTGVVVN